MEFPHLERGLVGISDRVIRDHLRLYRGWLAELDEIRAARAAAPWAPPAGVPAHELQALLDAPVASLNLQIEGPLSDVLEELRGELVAKGISWFPDFYLGEAEFWTADGATSVNVPWYLASEALWRLVNDQTDRLTPEEVLRILRHEAGHAVGYAFELWRRPEWRAAFGDFSEPYRDEYVPDPASTDHVRNLHRARTGANLHYAQKHPDEDWAETFGTWLDPGLDWRAEYAAWPGALAKLEAVQRLVADLGAVYGEPTNRRPGRRVPYRDLGYTVAGFLGQRVPGQWSPGAALLRREPEVYDAVVLHEAYFGALRRGAGAGGPGARLAAAAADGYGGADAWLADLRAAAAAASGWALSCWDARAGRLRNFVVAENSQGVPAGCSVLVALDVHEHAHVGDHPSRGIYVAAFLRNLDWAVVEGRLRAAQPPPPAPRLDQVLYAPPNADGSRKRCANCYLFSADGGCAVHARSVPVTPDHVCGYHLFGEPAARRILLPVLPIAPELSGLALVPGGTSCGTCLRFSGVTGAGFGSCGAVAGADGAPPAMVQPLGCCGRWEPAAPPPAQPLPTEPIPTAGPP